MCLIELPEPVYRSESSRWRSGRRTTTSAMSASKTRAGPMPVPGTRSLPLVFPRSAYINPHCIFLFSSCGEPAILFPMLLMTAMCPLGAFCAVVRVSGRFKRNTDVSAPSCFSTRFLVERMGRWFCTYLYAMFEYSKL